jgi:hypothetical protein
MDLDEETVDVTVEAQIDEADIVVDKVTELQDKTDDLALSLFDALRFLPSARKANHESQVRMYQEHIRYMPPEHAQGSFLCFCQRRPLRNE